MKDGIYRVTANVGGQLVVAEAQVRNGVFQGLGELSGMVGVFDFAAVADQGVGSETGITRGIHWQRVDLTTPDATMPTPPPGASPPLPASDDAPHEIRLQLDAFPVPTDQQRMHADRFGTNVEATWDDGHRKSGSAAVDRDDGPEQPAVRPRPEDGDR